MMLWDIPNVHSNDPETSALAAERIAPVRSRDCQTVLALVIRHPESTACELWNLATEAEKTELKEMQRIRQRMTDLKRLELVESTGSRSCGVRGTKQQTWRVKP